jgi:hypothetical protein
MPLPFPPHRSTPPLRRRKIARHGLWFLVAAARLSAAAVEGLDGSLRLDQVQYIGTHNSYHIAPGPEIAALVLRENFSLQDPWTAPRLVEATDFSHLPLADQLRAGHRQFELDVHDDPVGGRYAAPGFLRLLGARAPAIPGLDDLRRPGFKVFHEPEWDFRSTNYLLSSWLRELEAWSQTNQGHLPLIVQIEAKQVVRMPDIGGQPAVPSLDFTGDTWRRLEEEIKSVIPARKIFTPDNLRGEYTDLRDAVLARGWPTLMKLRGRFIFLLLNKEKETRSYLQLDPRLRGRLFFVSVGSEDPAAAWFRVPDPARPGLRDLISRGFLATVVADQHTQAARRNDPAQRETAFASGAQFILTDFPKPDSRFSEYCVRFSGGAYVRPNPARFAAVPSGR